MALEQLKKCNQICFDTTKKFLKGKGLKKAVKKAATNKALKVASLGSSITLAADELSGLLKDSSGKKKKNKNR